MRRGDLVTVAIPGDFGKPRPALVIQADRFDTIGTVTLLPVSSTLVAIPLLRVDVEPTEDNNLRKPSQIMVDKAATVRRDKVGAVFGKVDQSTLLAVARSLALFLGFD